MKIPYSLLVALVTTHVVQVLADSCADPSQAVPVFRDFNDAVGDHFYTTNNTEYSAANSGGYFPEGPRFAVFPTAVSSTTHLIRLWNGDATDHFYTTNTSEANSAAAGGYTIESLTPMFIYSTQLCGSVPLYRSWSPTNRDHFYTTSATERDGETGYTFELIAGYVLPLASGSSSASGNVAAGTSGSTPGSASDSASPPTNTNSSPRRSPHGTWLFSLLFICAIL
ncbi:hypothetical protein B0H14DRAFT_1083748 [Mycena olivaceomarginata]|nr:hypothetical protein B0H14DRAFT_1369942 [Mycena olivaceomarginata]KAJ7838528.1 hypothetical protein B0H14DRAFT_1083748 [Mycena olivaceomarginata]